MFCMLVRASFNFVIVLVIPHLWVTTAPVFDYGESSVFCQRTAFFCISDDIFALTYLS